MTDTTLPSEVTEALYRLAAPFDPFISNAPLSSGGGSLHDTRVCADALCRLAEENARLLAANRDCVDHFEQMRGELVALKARIADAPTCNVMLRNCDPPIHVHDVVCYDEKFMDKWMRVRLLVEDGERE